MDASLCARLEAGTVDGAREGADVRRALSQWDAELSAQGISPGGCADMLALTLLAHFSDHSPS